MGNHLRTTVLLAALTALMMLIGQWMGGRQGMFIALLLAAGMNFFSYWFSDKIVLRMYHAREVTAQQAPHLHAVVQELAHRGGLPMPKVCIIPEASPNAFATGRDPEHAVVAVTQGLLELMDHAELKGVLAHELAHVKNRDILIGSIAATMAGAIMMLANMARWAALFGGSRRDDQEGGGSGLSLLVMSILAPVAAVVIQMAVSRSREYHADATGAGFAGSSEGLARALEKLAAYSQQRPMQANPSTAHMFIVNPLSGRSLMTLFSTHPPIPERVARLRNRRPPTAPGEPQSSQAKGLAQGRSHWDHLS